uniref:Uncharacterized protein n=1 Tax=Podoviridae sp. ct6BA50 TaxID=2825221 RepID=A0A8S5VGG7_9CAUD|nr:MAG TPA: hypothetical protein [Podoviridae sp. ct6BA50]DAQ40793.1 MAG TPA: hypothetical protein [Caudoviricetes sp.]
MTLRVCIFVCISRPKKAPKAKNTAQSARYF